MTEPMRIFLDTDFGPDCDDTAALAILLQLGREGRAMPIGISHATGSPYGLAAIDTVCRLFDVRSPMGTLADRGFLTEKALRFAPAMAASFPHGYPPEAPQPDAVEALDTALKDVPDGSVTVIGIGPMGNMARFVTEPEAAGLMARKVERIVLMAGTFVGDGVEWNVEMDVRAMQAVVRRWAGRLDLCPFEAFGDVLTGRSLVRDRESPVGLAYRLFTEGSMLRPSWDPGTVACAILGPRSPLRWSDPGTLTVDERGRTRFCEASHGRHRILLRRGGPEPVAEWLEGLLAKAEDTMQRAMKEGIGTAGIE